ncbi:discoidin, CUB and LCCL domain-containing protein 1 [Aplochiton taeniatus]
MSDNIYILGFFVFWILSAFGEKLDDGCGHTVLGPESGVLSSRNYPDTYPNHTWCEWHLRGPAGSRLALRLGDLDIEGRDCRSDYLRVLRAGYAGEHVYGTFCGGLMSYVSKEIHTDTNEVTVQFRSAGHVSGRGFLLSYSIADHRDLLTCLDKGIHFKESKYRKYCPAGCRDVAGEVSGDVAQGYRETSVLCKAAVHAGVVQDGTGGWVSVERHKGLSHYPSARANGIQSKSGSLSDYLFTFLSNELKNQSVLYPVAISASSGLQKPAGPETGLPSRRTPDTQNHSQGRESNPGGRAGATRGLPRAGSTSWVSEQMEGPQWLQLDLGEKKRITGIVISGELESDHYVKSYSLEHKEKNRWRPYTHYNSTENMIFEGNQDGLHKSRTTLHPPMVTRYLRVLPLSWHQRVAMTIELLGSAHIKGNLSTLSTLESHPTVLKPPVVEEKITEAVPSQTDLGKLAIIVAPIGLVLVLLLIGICVFKMLQKKKTKESSYGSSEDQKAGCWKQIKQPFGRHQSTEFPISYSSEKDPIQKLDLVTSTMAEYQQPLMIGMGTVSRKGSTFRPMDTETKEEAGDPATHYDFLQTANQYALPLTNQEPEYATPIIERHTFRKDNFLSEPGSYNVPGAVLSKSPSFKTSEGGGHRKPGVGGSPSPRTGGYQTPQVKRIDRGAHLIEGVYDCPKVNTTQGNGCLKYQRPQGQPGTLPPDTYSTPRDSVRRGPVLGPALGQSRPEPEGSSGGI